MRTNFPNLSQIITIPQNNCNSLAVFRPFLFCIAAIESVKGNKTGNSVLCCLYNKKRSNKFTFLSDLFLKIMPQAGWFLLPQVPR